MKKILIGLFLVAALPCLAATHSLQSFMNVTSLNVSNGVLGVTNLYVSALHVSTATNAASLTWTNNAGTAITNTQANITNYQTGTFPLLSAVNLIPNGTGQAWPGPTFAADTSTVTAAWATGNGTSNTSYVVTESLQTGNNFQTPMSLVIKMQCDSGAEFPVNFRFAGQPGLDKTLVPIGAEDIWTVGVKGIASTVVTIRTNVPVHLWPGFRNLALLDIDNTEEDSSGGVTITDITVVGWQP